MKMVFSDDEHKKKKGDAEILQRLQSYDYALVEIRARRPQVAMQHLRDQIREEDEIEKKQIGSSSAAAGGVTTSDESSSLPTGPLKVRVVYSSPKGGVMFRRSPLRAPPTPAMVVKKRKYGKRKVRKLTEEEVQAARCLVALSSCSDFA